jgi:hydroxypyruvate isomerase
MKMSRKEALTKLAVAGAGVTALPLVAHSINTLPVDLKNSINHSVCQWCFSYFPLEQLVIEAKKIGIKSQCRLLKLHLSLSYGEGWGEAT